MSTPQNTRTRYDLIEVNRPQSDRQSVSSFLNRIFNNDRRLASDKELNSKFKAYLNPDMPKGPLADAAIAEETRQALSLYWGVNNAPEDWFVYPMTPNLDEAAPPVDDPANNWAGPYAPAPGSPREKDNLTTTRPDVPEDYLRNLPNSTGYYPIAPASDYRSGNGAQRKTQQREIIVQAHENSIVVAED